MKLPVRGIPVYSGKISTTGFQFGRFIRSPELGLIAVNANVKGKGFKWDNNLDINIHAKFNAFNTVLIPIRILRLRVD